jgi:3-oxoacyl-[acyl-carrier protein] reductase
MDMTRLEGRIAVVTGGASGLGLAAVRSLRARGASVAIWDLSENSLLAAKVEFGGDCEVTTCQVDVANQEAVEAAAAQTRKALGTPAMLVAAAGIPGPVAPFTEWSVEDFRRVIDVNLLSGHLLCRALVPDMVKAKWGRVVLVTSVAGKEGNINQSGYVAAKAGLIGYVKCLGKELAMSGVLVNAIAPTVFDTPMLQAAREAGPETMAAMAAKVPMGRLGQPDEFGEMAAWLCSPACSFTTGTTFDLSGGRTTY